MIAIISHLGTKSDRLLADICRQLDITLLAEGLETAEEVAYFDQLGVQLMQGYYFARPGFQCLPSVAF